MKTVSHCQELHPDWEYYIWPDGGPDPLTVLNRQHYEFYLANDMTGANDIFKYVFIDKVPEDSRQSRL